MPSVLPRIPTLERIRADRELRLLVGTELRTRQIARLLGLSPSASRKPMSQRSREAAASEAVKPILAPLERHVADEVMCQLSKLYPELFPPRTGGKTRRPN